MAYANQVDYTNWLRGRAPTIPLAEFDFWAHAASQRIDESTFNRLHDADTLLDHAQVVTDLTCEIAEIIFSESETGYKMLSGVKIADASESYERSDAMHPQSRINSAIRRALGMTGLLYRGV